MVGDRAVGDWIANRFEIFDIHEGGMSRVYIVHDHKGEPGRMVVALKTLRDELLINKVRRSRFATECRLWVQLGEHSNIVQAHSVEILEGSPFVMLELVQGGDLVRWIGTPRLDLPQALRFGVQFCQGMEHASRQGLSCHRDIKPANLMITQDGILKITDFGLARICEEMVSNRPAQPDGFIPLEESARSVPRIIYSDPKDQEIRPIKSASATPRAVRAATKAKSPSSSTLRPPNLSPNEMTTFEKSADSETVDHQAQSEAQSTSANNLRLTHTGARLGTGAYMAPEQFRDPATVDHRVDIYAFGVVLFEMITGQLPFRGRSMAMLDRQHTKAKPPSVVPFIPRAFARLGLATQVDEIVQRCLMKDPADRYPTVTVLRKALLAALARTKRR